MLIVVLSITATIIYFESINLKSLSSVLPYQVHHQARRLQNESVRHCRRPYIFSYIYRLTQRIALLQAPLSQNAPPPLGTALST